MQNRPVQPIVIYDGECGFCRFWIQRWKQRTGDAVDYTPSQDESIRQRFPEIPPEAPSRSVLLVLPDGRVFAGAEAAIRALKHATGGRTLLSAYEKLPGFAPFTEAAYAVVARNRTFFSFCTRLLWGGAGGPPRFDIATTWFLRLLGLIYIVAFWSLGAQLTGLIGAHGLEPVADFMSAARRQIGGPDWSTVRILPTFCWWDTSDAFLALQWRAGVVCGAALAAGVLQGPMLLALWMLYLSLTTVGGDFLAFQWDNLLLETGFLAIWLAPWKLWSGWSKPPVAPRPARWLLWWLLFRLMFASGWVKLLSGDETWRKLTALRYHFQTQPLPTPLAWYAHHLPAGVHTFCTGAMFFIELVLPFAIVLPRRLRHFAGFGFTLLQIVIILTGNYTFFNGLTLALVLLLFDDAFFTRSSTTPAAPEDHAPARFGFIRSATLIPVAAVIFLVSAWQNVAVFARHGYLRSSLLSLVAWTAPLRSINSYGLFAVMTTTRNEIVIEGSNDGRVWLEYEFPSKPGDVQRRPGFVAPLQPRLDWQMWFAALGSVRQNAWFSNLIVRLFQGEPSVLALLAKNPFPDHPPQFLRARFYEYRFTTAAGRASGKGWWVRELKGDYFPVVSRTAVLDNR